MSRRRRTALCCLLAAPLAACCATQWSSTGYRRSCVPAPWRHSRPAPAAPGSSAPRLDGAWDPELGIYVVAGNPCLFLRHGALYRLGATGWSTASAPEGPWREVAADALPAGFRADRAQARCGAREAS